MTQCEQKTIKSEYTKMLMKDLKLYNIVKCQATMGMIPKHVEVVGNEKKPLFRATIYDGYSLTFSSKCRVAPAFNK